MLLLSFALGVTGCGSNTSTTTKSESGKPEAAKADPWEGFVKRFRKDTDASTCRTALNALNGDLANRPDVPGPAALAADAEKVLAALVPLAPTDLSEIKSGSFSNLDPAYLAECMYLRDAAKSLELPNQPPAKAADGAFAFVCRQVYLNPWVYSDQLIPAVPPTSVLRRGHGGGIERAYVFLALLQQMGIDGCLIGPPEAADRPTGYTQLGPDGKPLSPVPLGPFWAVGARVGNDIQVYDPWRGEKFPANFAQLKANPDVLKPWFDTKTWLVTADDVKKAAVFLAVPVSGLAPRMALLEEKLKADFGVRLAVNAPALHARFADVQAKFWGPLTDRYAYGRLLPSFLSPEEGGLDRSDPQNRLSTLYRVFLLPRAVLQMPSEIQEVPVRDRLITFAATTYEQAFHAPPTPRERLQRGDFQEASRALAGKRDAFLRGQERLRNPQIGAQLADWAKRANEAHAALSRAQSFDPAAVPAAQNAVNEFWVRNAGGAQLAVDQATARVGGQEASFLIALGKHEEAERQQARSELAAAGEAERRQKDATLSWSEAANAWESFTVNYGPRELAGFPGREPHVSALSARAKALAGK